MRILLIAAMIFAGSPVNGAEPPDPVPVFSQVAPASEAYGFSSLRRTGNGFIAARFPPLDLSRSVVALSSDGVSWKTVYHSPGKVLTDAAAGGGTHVAIGWAGFIVRSTHGYSWAQSTSGVTENLNAVIWSGEAYIAVGAEGSVLRSVDGLSWQTTRPVGNVILNSVVHSGGRIDILGRSGTLLSSTDHGMSWVTHASSTAFNFQTGAGLGSDLILYTPTSATGPKIVVFRADGTFTETTAPVSTFGEVLSISSRPEGCLMVSRSGGLYSTKDGVLWHRLEQTMREGDSIYGDAVICGTDDGWLVGGYLGEILRFAPGLSWNQPVTSSYALGAVIENSGRYYAFGAYGSVGSSDDGVNWVMGSGLVNSAYHWRSATRWNGGVQMVGKRGTTQWIKSGSTSEISALGTTTTEMYGVAASDSLLVAVGAGGLIYRSGSGSVWSSASSGTIANLYSVEYAFGKFHAVGAGGVILSSSNGSTWSPVLSNTSADLKRIKLTSMGLFAAGGDGAIIRSTDGGTWVAQVSGTTHELAAITERPGEILALGKTGSVVASKDGINWLDVTPRQDGHSGDFTDAICVNGKVLGITEDRRKTSVGGSVKSSVFALGSTRQVSHGSSWQSVVHFSGDFIRGGSGGLIETSPDGEVWTARESRAQFDIRGMATSGNLVAAVGNGGVLISGDGIDWKLTASTGLSFTKVLYGGNKWIACGYSGALMISDDGFNWRYPTDTLKVIGTTNFDGIAYGGGRFLISGESGVLLASTDGETWSKVTVPTTNDFRGLARIGANFVASIETYNYEMLVSPDGLTWQKVPGLPVPFVNGLKTIGGRCFAFTDREALYSSLDGLTWTTHRDGYFDNTSAMHRFATLDISGSGDRWVSVGTAGISSWSDDMDHWTYTEGIAAFTYRGIFRARNQFVALGTRSVLLTTPDCVRWTRHPAMLPFGKYLLSFADSGQRAIVVGDGVFYSDDLVTWVKVAAPPATQLQRAAWGGGRFIATGADNGIYESTDGVDWVKTGQSQTSAHSITDHAGVLLVWTANQILKAGVSGWAPASFPFIASRYSSVYQDDDGIVASSGSGWVGFSTDSVNWTERFNQGKNIGLISRQGRGLYFTATTPPNLLNGSTVLTSADGLVWNDTGTIHPPSPTGIAGSSYQIVTTHYDGEVMIGGAGRSAAFHYDLMGEGYPQSEDLTPGGDPNGDQIPNLVARYFGIPLIAPSEADEQSRLPSVAFDGGLGKAVLSIPTQTPAYLRLEVEESTDLAGWGKIATRLPDGTWISDRGITSDSIHGGLQRFEIAEEFPKPDQYPRFWRARIVEIP